MDINQFAKEYTKKKHLYDKKTHRNTKKFEFFLLSISAILAISGAIFSFINRTVSFYIYLALVVYYVIFYVTIVIYCKKHSDKIQQTSKEKKIYLQNLIINLLSEKGIDTNSVKSLNLVSSTFDHYIGDLKNPLYIFLQGLNSIFFPLALACIQAGFQENTIANNSLLYILIIFTIISSICIAFSSPIYAIENKNKFVALEIHDYLLDYILEFDCKNSRKHIINHWKHYE